MDINNLKQVIGESFSWRSALTKLNEKYRDYNILKFKNICSANNINFSHFLGQGSNKNKTFERVDINEYLSNSRQITTHKLRCLLIERGVKQHKCEKCNNTHWLNDLIPLELHHIDGNNKNNNLTNLTLLCPNCHALTPNYRAANKKQGKNREVTDDEIIKAVKSSYSRREALIKVGLAGYGGNYPRINKLIDQHNLSFLKSERQLKAEAKLAAARQVYESGEKFYDKETNPNWRTEPKLEQRKVERPSKEDLAQLIKDKPLLQIGKQFGVSDNTIRKWCQWYDLSLPNYPKGYWLTKQTN